MSINSKIQVKCPACENLQDETVWSIISANDDPDLKEKLLKREINVFKCSACEQVALIPVPLLYHDREKKLLISFKPCNDDTEAEQLFEDLKKNSNKSGELDQYVDYNLRFVSKYDDLMEKIIIFDNDLNDKVLEVIKVLLLSQEPDKIDDRDVLFGKIEGESIEFLVRDKKEKKFLVTRLPLGQYETIKLQLMQSGVKDKSFDWEWIDTAYGANLIGGINNNM